MSVFQRWDSALALYDYGAHYYDPALGGFVQADTLVPEPGNPQAWDRYAYVNNNPLRYNDPTGHCPWCIAVGIGALVGAGIGYGIQVYQNYQSGLSGAAAWTQNISAEPIINGAFIGAGAVIGAFVVTEAAVALLPAATTAGALSCADGDCTNEVTAAVNAVNNAANAACADGDCTNEATALARTLGSAGEQAAGIVKNNERIVSLTGTANFRVPDQLLADEKLLSEVKNVAYQSLTNQIKDYWLYARQEGFTFELIVRENTKFSQSLQRLIDAGEIVIRRNLLAR